MSPACSVAAVAAVAAAVLLLVGWLVWVGLGWFGLVWVGLVWLVGWLVQTKTEALKTSYPSLFWNLLGVP